MLKIKFNQNIAAVIFFAFLSLAAFFPFFIQGKIPVPGDVILAGYYPWQDIKWDNIQTIFPVLNPTISDSVTSFYPWRQKSIEMIKQGKFPLFDDSSYMGSPLFSTGTTGLLYPLNFIFFILPFSIGWGLQVAITPFLAATFFYIWLKHKQLNYWAVVLGSICYAFSGFIALQFSFVNSPHAVIWLPLMLLCIDKLLNKFTLSFFLLFIFALYSSLNAGFFQGSLYIMGFAFFYLIYNLFSERIFNKKSILYFLPLIFALFLSAIQMVPFLETTFQSSRISNSSVSLSPEVINFFVKPQYFLTTIIPDFFGNPGKQNYFGAPNYYEFNNFSGTIIVIGVLFLLTSFKTNRRLLFYWITLGLSVLFVTPNPISQFIYQQSIPIISSLTPSRLLLITQFSMIVLSVYGLDLFFTKKVSSKAVITVLGSILISFLSILTLLLLTQPGDIPFIMNSNIVSLRNTLLSFGFFIIISIGMLLFQLSKKTFFVLSLILITSFELIRQTSYFRPFTKPELLYPNTPLIYYLQNNSQNYRYIIQDPQSLPSNLQSIYNLETPNGYSPISSERYSRFIKSITSQKNVKQDNYGRTIFLNNYSSPLIDLLNVKFILTTIPPDQVTKKLNFISKENSLYLYENSNTKPRVWISKQPLYLNSDDEVLDKLTSKNFDYKNQVIVQESTRNQTFSNEKGKILDIEVNDGTISFKSSGDGVAVISMQYLPGWKAYIDDNPTQVFPADYGLMGINLPPGNHNVKLVYSPSSFKMGLITSGVTLFLLILTILFITFKQNKIRHRHN